MNVRVSAWLGRWRGALLVLLLVFALYGAAIAWATGDAAEQAWRGLWSPASAAAALLCLLSYALRGWRWRLWMAHLGRPLPAAQALRWYVAGYAFTPTPANLGEAARGLLPRQRPLSLGDSAALFGAERLADLMALLLLALPAGWVLLMALALTDPTASAVASGTAAHSASSSVLLWSLFGALALVALVGLTLWATRRRWQSLQALRTRAPWLAQAGQCLRHRPAQWASLTLLAWCAQGLAVWLLCRQAGMALDPLLATSSYALAMVAGAASALPAGLGGTELVLAGLLVSHGAAAQAAVVLTVQVRLLTLWLAVALGVLCLYYSVRLRRDLRLI